MDQAVLIGRNIEEQVNAPCPAPLVKVDQVLFRPGLVLGGCETNNRPAWHSIRPADSILALESFAT